MDSLFCQACDIRLDSATNWAAHMVGKSHLSKVRNNVPASSLYCQPCGKQCDNKANFEGHCLSKVHVALCGKPHVTKPAPIQILVDDSDDVWEEDGGYPPVITSPPKAAAQHAITLLPPSAKPALSQSSIWATMKPADPSLAKPTATPKPAQSTPTGIITIAPK